MFPGKRVATWAAAIAAIALVTFIGRILGLNATTVGFVYLIVVVFISVWGDLLVGTVGEAAGRALRLLGARGGGLVVFAGSTYRQTVISWNGEKPDEIEDLIAGVGRHKEPLEMPSPLGRDVYLPLFVGGRTTGVLVARGTTASKKGLESAARLVALAVEREHFIEENAHMQALRESEALKTSLLRAISHDLTTPLTAITLRTESLRRRPASDPKTLDDIAAIAEETSRLRRR